MLNKHGEHWKNPKAQLYSLSEPLAWLLPTCLLQLQYDKELGKDCIFGTHIVVSEGDSTQFYDDRRNFLWAFMDIVDIVCRFVIGVFW